MQASPIRGDALQDNDACLRAVQLGRADIFMTDAGLAAALAKQFADTLDNGFSLPSEYRFGVGVHKENTELMNAVYDGLKAIQDDGTETTLLAKWGFDPGQLEPARIVRSKGARRHPQGCTARGHHGMLSRRSDLTLPAAGWPHD